MIPNLSLPSIKIFGPVKIHPFGLLVGLAVIVGYQLILARARKTGLDLRTMADAGLWAVILGFVAAHLFWAFFYNYRLVVEDPLVLLRVWEGISSYGGFFGGVLGGWILLRRRKVQSLPYLEALLFGLVPAWVIARLGCTIAFDHPGRETSFVLGMVDAAGVVRHNLGFYEMLWTAVITAALFALRNVRPFPAFHGVLVFLLYAPARIYFDSLRIDDRTFLGFTPGQYSSLVLLAAAVYFLVRGMKSRGKG